MKASFCNDNILNTPYEQRFKTKDNNIKSNHVTEINNIYT